MAENGDIRTGTYGLVHERPLEELETQLDEVSFLLGAWARSETSDSVRRQELRRREYAQACELINRVWADVFGTDRQIRITTPSDAEPIKTKSLDKNAYDLIEVGRGKDLAPGESAILKTHRTTLNTRERATHHYYGDYRGHDFEVADLARILAAGGSLDLADVSVEVERAEG